MITPLEVVDTGIKIGLGALITGATAYWLAKLTHERQRQKERAVHKQELLESVADSVQKYYYAATKQRSFVEYAVGIVNAGGEPTESQYTELAQCEAELIDATKEINSAEAKLLLLGERESYDLLRAFHEDVSILSTDYLKQTCESKQTLEELFSVDSLAKYRDILRQGRDSFFNSLRSAYDRT